jgi:hypothetical protein
MINLGSCRWDAAVREWVARAGSCLSPAAGGGWTRNRTGDHSGAPADPQTVARLRGWLYQDAHLGVDVTGSDAAGVDEAGTVALLHSLTGGGWASSGWQVRRRADGRWEASKDGVRLLVEEDDVAAGRLEAGGTVSLWLPRARPGALPGWFALSGPQGPPPSVDSRVYLHLRALTAEHLRAAIAGLHELRCPWQAKFNTRPSGSRRPDCVVVYTHRSALLHVVATLSEHPLCGSLVDPVPGFSIRVRAGMSCSVDLPGLPGGSFGARVADLLAKELVAAQASGEELERRVVAALRERDRR